MRLYYTVSHLFAALASEMLYRLARTLVTLLRIGLRIDLILYFCLQIEHANLPHLKFSCICLPWLLQVMIPSACSFIVFWFSLSFTTCFGLHGYLQVCRIFRIFIFICLKDFASLLFSFVAFFFHKVTLCMFSICVLFLCCFPYFFLFPTHTHARKQHKTRRKTAQEQNTNGKHAECDHVKKAAKQNP
jgi:hypothetical protein